MATDANIYSLTEWQFAIKPEATVGTANVTNMQLVNVDVPITINDNPSIANEIRTKDGRTKKAVDHFATKEGQVKSITISGIADKTVLLILAENCFGIARASNIIDLPYNFTGSAFKYGKTSIGDNLHTLTVALVSVIADNTRIYPGCIVDELSWVEDVETDGGRRHFTATFLTRSNPSNDQATPSGMVAYPSTYYSIWDYTEKYFGGPELWDPDAAEMLDSGSPGGTYAWVIIENNTINNVSDTLVITFFDNDFGSYNWLKDASDLNANLIIGKNYRYECDAKYAGGIAGVKLRIDLDQGNTLQISDALTTSLKRYAIDFNAETVSTDKTALADMVTDNVVTLDNFSLIRSDHIIMSKLEISIKSNVKFYGLGTDGVCEVMDRGLPGFDVSAVIGVKYDSETMSQYLKYPAGTAIKLFVGDEIALADASIGIRSDYSYLTSDLNIGNVDEGAFIDIPLEFKASTSGSQLQIAL